MKYCGHCGSTISFKVPDNDDRERHVCDECGHIHYENPRIITGTLPVHNDKILLCKRAIAPREGYWTLPAGFLENGETIQAGAIRETWEEARANITVSHLYHLYNLPHIHQVYAFYLAELNDLTFGPGPESTEVELFSAEEIPWTELAFPVVEKTLALYLEDKKENHFPFRELEINKRPLKS